MRFLRQATASQEILLGPFVATADGTAQTGLTIANTDIKLLLGGATAEQNKNSGGGTHIAAGRYSAVLDATDTATVGILEVSVAPASGIPWNKSYYVLEEAVYDAFFAASAAGYNSAQVVASVTGAVGSVTGAVGSVTGAVGSVTGAVGSVTTVSSGAISAASFATTAGAFAPLGVVDQGTAQSATGTTLVLRAAAAFADDELIGATIQITGGTTGVGQSRLITDYVSATDTATVAAWTVTPTGTITYKIYGTAPASAGGAPTAGEIADAVWDEATAGHTTSGTFGEQVKTNIDAILVDTGTTLDGKIDAIDDLLDTEIPALTTAVADIPTNAELATALGTADDAVLAQVALVKAKTDSLTFTVANVLDANVQRINDVEVVGVGTEANKWRA
jgi:hypothetical protein